MTTEQGEIAAGRVLLECLIAGWLGVIGAVALTVVEREFVAGAVCLIAAAIAFGLRANAVLRR